MPKFDEARSRLSALLKDNLTADNTEFITQANNLLKELEEGYTDLQGENTKLKDKIVDYVGKFEFKDEPKDEIDPSPMSIDEALKAAVDKVISERK